MNAKPTKNRRPWNRVNEQIYSLSTLDNIGQINMNIASYVTPTTLKPKSYVIAVYRGTKTHQNMFGKGANTHFLLQALSKPQIKYVRSLGQKSALKYDKAKYLSKQNLELYNYEHKSYAFLPGCAFVILCKIISKITNGDHDLIIADVIKVVADNKAADFLTTDDLIEQRIIL